MTCSADPATAPTRRISTRHNSGRSPVSPARWSASILGLYLARSSQFPPAEDQDVAIVHLSQPDYTEIDDMNRRELTFVSAWSACIAGRSTCRGERSTRLRVDLQCA